MTSESNLKPPYGMSPTNAERAEQESLFPSLKQWSVTDAGDISYNCIGWSLGSKLLGHSWFCSWVVRVSRRIGWSLGGQLIGWVWPGDTVADFDMLYTQHGYVVSGDRRSERGKRKIALFCSGKGVPTHAAREASDGGWWESKKGGSLRILHRLNELEGGLYGNVSRCYEKPDPSANQDLNDEGEET